MATKTKSEERISRIRTLQEKLIRNPTKSTAKELAKLTISRDQKVQTGRRRKRRAKRELRRATRVRNKQPLFRQIIKERSKEGMLRGIGGSRTLLSSGNQAKAPSVATTGTTLLRSS